MTRILIVLCASATALSCFAAVMSAAPSSSAPAPAPAPMDVTELTPLSQRLSDEDAARDEAVFDSWEQRLHMAAAGGGFVYQGAKALAWLEFARKEYALEDEDGTDQAALDQAVALIRAMEAGKTALSAAGPLIARAERVGEPHWELVETVRQSRDFLCVEAEIAKMELELVQAGHEKREGNPCLADEHLETAGRLADLVRAKAEVCSKPWQPDLTPAEIQKRIQKLPTFVHFALDSDGISLASVTILDTIAAVLGSIPSVAVQIEGHADSRASSEYNLDLSRRRAMRVANYLKSKGVARERMHVFWYGKSRPRAKGESILSYARNRRVVFTYFPPEGVDLEPEAQENDLQIERRK